MALWLSQPVYFLIDVHRISKTVCKFSMPCSLLPEIPYKSKDSPQAKGNYWSEFRRVNKTRLLFASNRSCHHKMGDRIPEFQLSKVFFFLFWSLWSESDLACLIIWPNLFITFGFKEGVQGSPSSARRVSLVPSQTHTSCSRDLSRWRSCLWPWSSQVQWLSMLAVPPRSWAVQSQHPCLLPFCFWRFPLFSLIVYFILIFQAIAFSFVKLMFPLSI